MKFMIVLVAGITITTGRLKTVHFVLNYYQHITNKGGLEVHSKNHILIQAIFTT